MTQSCRLCLKLDVTASASLSLSLSHSLTNFDDYFVLIFVWRLGKCKKLVENVFPKVFLGIQSNT